MPTPRPEYPRPQMVRQDWTNLNGIWQFCFDDQDQGRKEQWYLRDQLGRSIQVPFCYQSPASGIGQTEKHTVLWYSRLVTIPEPSAGKRLLLHFGAVDYQACVWVDGQYAGCHTGGYTPFSFDITDLLKGQEEHRISVRVEDTVSCTQLRGKQSWLHQPFSCWYVPVSGIWQTVWLETVDAIHIRQLYITPDIDHSQVELEMELSGLVQGGEWEAEISFEGEGRVRYVFPIPAGSTVAQATLRLAEPDKVDNVHYWRPEAPHLYDIRIRLHVEGSVRDQIGSYFGMRKVDIQRGKICLNNAPYYQKLVLDQGYWPEGIYTAPTDEAIRRDVELTKEMGFNGARKHQKIEDPRYYYWADKLGLLVWGELPGGFEYCRAEVNQLMETQQEFIRRDYNHPCIVCWVPLNESWGVRNIVSDLRQQACARALYHLIKALDSTRLVSANDGWEQVDSDICGIHDYEAWSKDLRPRYQAVESLLSANQSRMLYAKGFAYQGQPVLITEYGGIAFEKDSQGQQWGYNGSVADGAAFIRRYSDITAGFRSLAYVQGYCYTQLTDVYQEVNGLLDMHRRPKAPLEKIREINR